MKKSLVLLGAVLFGCVFLGACASYKATPQAIFDLGGTASSTQPNAGLPPMSVAEPNVPAWLDNIEMYYRLNYANEHQVRPYTNSRWSMPPLQLFVQRLKSRIAESGGSVLSSTENAGNVPLVLHIDADDFSQVFESAERSSGQITLRVSLFNRRNLVAQKIFSRQASAASGDAASGARALSVASDAMIVDILQWLSALNLKQ